MSLGKDLRTFLIRVCGAVIQQRAHQNKVPQSYQGTYVWYGRRSTDSDTERELDERPGNPYHFREVFDVEVIGFDVDEVENAAELLKAASPHRGALGDGQVQAIFTRDANDDYIPRGVMSDEGLHVSALEFECVDYRKG